MTLGRAFSIKLRRQHPGISWAARVCDDTVSLLVLAMLILDSESAGVESFRDIIWSTWIAPSKLLTVIPDSLHSAELARRCTG